MHILDYRKVCNMAEPINVLFPKPAIEYFDHWVVVEEDWDAAVKAHGWYAADVVFGLVFEYLTPGQRILDLGCGTGLASEPFARFGLEVYGIDGSPNMLAKFQ